jgi:hypothetical protein
MFAEAPAVRDGLRPSRDSARSDAAQGALCRYAAHAALAAVAYAPSCE